MSAWAFPLVSLEFMASMSRSGVSASVVLALAALISALSCGCTSNAPVAVAGDRETGVLLRIVAIQYGEYLAMNRGTPPPDEAAFRKFLDSRPDVLASYNVKSPDEILKSPRDGQPFVIVCGKVIAPPDSPGTPWAAYEQTGVDGKRMAATVRGGIYELTPEDFARQLPAA
jgi:hypothetical protein